MPMNKRPIVNSMRPIVSGLLLLVACTIAVADTVLVNDEDAVFYFRRGASRLTAEDVASERLDYVPPGSFRMIQGDAPVRGFFFLPGRTSHPLATVNPTPPSSRLRIPAVPEAMVEALVPPEVGASIRLDRRFLDWSRISPIARFSRHFLPTDVERTDDAGRAQVSAEDARLFGRGGSDLEMLRMLRDDGDFYLMAASYSALAPGFSLLLYGFESDSASAPRYTAELTITEELPAVLLWRPGREEPVVVGTFVRSSFFLEAVIWDEALPEGFSLLEGVEFFEVSTSVTDLGIREEYPLTRVGVHEVPVAPAGS